MAGGRPPLGPALVETLDGPEEAKRRLRAILEVLSREKSVETACAELGIERARFYQLERAALLAALGGLEPKPPGRPPRPAPSEAELEVERLRERLAQAKFDALAATVREEVATAMPYVLESLEAREKKRHERNRRKRW